MTKIDVFFIKITFFYCKELIYLVFFNELIFNLVKFNCYSIFAVLKKLIINKFINSALLKTK